MGWQLFRVRREEREEKSGEGSARTEAESTSIENVSRALRGAAEQAPERGAAAMEAAWRRDQEIFRQLAEHIREVFWLTDLDDNRVVYVSPAYQTVWGRRAEQLYSNPHDWTDAIHPDDRERVMEAWENDAIRGEFEETYRIERPDGSVRWIHDRGFPIRNEAGEVHRLAGLAEDITERRRIEEALRLSSEQLRSITESAPDYIMMLDSEARIVFINRTVPDLTRDQVLGTSIFDWVEPRFWPEMRACFDRVATNGEHGEFTVDYDSDGTPLTFESHVAPITTDGDIFAFVVNSRDVTRRVALETEIHESNARLRQLADRLQEVREEDRAQIAREIHDQLGQSLAGLRLDVAWLQKQADSADEEVKSRIEHSLGLIDGTLGSVRDLTVKLRPTSLDDLGLEAAIEAYVRDVCERSAIEWHMHGGIEGYRVEPANATAAYRILQEALTNIVRHADAQRVDIELSGTGGRLGLRVLDDGVGITDEQIVRVDSVGLTGMQERARACGGTVTFERRDGGGTAVDIDLPLESSGA